MLSNSEPLPRIRILHLSDLHYIYNHECSFYIEKFFDQLYKLSEDVDMLYLFITGDLFDWSAIATEEGCEVILKGEEEKKWPKAIKGLAQIFNKLYLDTGKKLKIFICGGNHDFDAKWNKHRIQNNEDIKKKFEWLIELCNETNLKYSIIQQYRDQYNQNNYFQGFHDLEINDRQLGIRVIGLNTSIYSKKFCGNVEDYKNLSISILDKNEDQAVLGLFHQSYSNLVLMHHEMDWLRYTDVFGHEKYGLFAKIYKKADLIFYGHTHSNAEAALGKFRFAEIQHVPIEICKKEKSECEKNIEEEVSPFEESECKKEKCKKENCRKKALSPYDLEILSTRLFPPWDPIRPQDISQNKVSHSLRIYIPHIKEKKVEFVEYKMDWKELYIETKTNKLLIEDNEIKDNNLSGSSNKMTKVSIEFSLFLDSNLKEEYILNMSTIDESNMSKVETKTNEIKKYHEKYCNYINSVCSELKYCNLKDNPNEGCLSCERKVKFKYLMDSENNTLWINEEMLLFICPSTFEYSMSTREVKLFSNECENNIRTPLYYLLKEKDTRELLSKIIVVRRAEGYMEDYYSELIQYILINRDKTSIT